MKVVLLNPPHPTPVQRRYMCSYNAGSMLLPPQELIALGGILKGFPEVNVHLMDCIADGWHAGQLREALELHKPDVIVSIQGFECFDEDMYQLRLIKQYLPYVTLVMFGHYTTVFAREILEKTPVDIAIKGEPDLIFKQLMEAILQGHSLETVGGIAYKKEGVVYETSGELRIREPDKLPMPAYELLHAHKYYEPFMKAPFGLIQSARGCPYSCNYCVRSFGKKLTYRTPEQIIDEIIYLKNNFGIRSLRFIDDTFTVHTNRVIEICQRMIALKLDIEWTCLSRMDTLREEMLPWMKKAGCKRIYFGVESGSPKVLRFLNKDLDLHQGESIIRKCKAFGIETLGFFIVGAPVEEEEDFQQSINFAINAELDYVSVSTLTLYPGTMLYEQLKHAVEFSLFPYKNEWKDPLLTKRNCERERKFYRQFYFRKKYVQNKIKHASKHPLEYAQNVLKLAGYILRSQQTARADYF